MRKAHALSVVVAVLAVFAEPTWAAEEAAPLFHDAFVKAAPVRPDPAAVRSRSVTADLSALLPGVGRPLTKAALRLNFNLFPDADFTATLEARVVPDQPYVAWRGHLEGVPGSVVTFVASRGQVAGHIRTPEKLYRVRFLGAGQPDLYAVEELDTSLLPEEEEPIRVEAADLGPEPGPVKSFDDGTRFDVLVVYTPAARDAAGGREAIENRIALALDETNLALERSRVLPRVRLVQASEIDYQEDVTDIGGDLLRLQGLAEVHSLRDAFRADTVTLIRSAERGSCGIGFLMGTRGAVSRGYEKFGFSVVSLQCLSGLTLPHEMGHNWGCNHAKADPTGKGAFPYSFGYKAPDGAFRTIMAYDCPGGCPRALSYSNPEVQEGGQPTGSGTANNALSIHGVRGTVANFRLSTPSDPATCEEGKGRFAACSDGGCSVCAEKLAAYPLYFFNHPDCNVNYACARSYSKCSADCPPPNKADTCSPAAGGWRGCGANGCAVCVSIETEFPNYFRNHPACTRDIACRAKRTSCNAACPAPAESDR